MRVMREALRKVAAVIFPWPAKHEREAAIRAARREKEHSQAGAREASAVEAQLLALASQNHFAQRIAEQIIRGVR